MLLLSTKETDYRNLNRTVVQNLRSLKLRKNFYKTIPFSFFKCVWLKHKIITFNQNKKLINKNNNKI